SSSASRRTSRARSMVGVPVAIAQDSPSPHIVKSTLFEDVSASGLALPFTATKRIGSVVVADEIEGGAFVRTVSSWLPFGSLYAGVTCLTIWRSCVCSPPGTGRQPDHDARPELEPELELEVSSRTTTRPAMPAPSATASAAYRKAKRP